MKKHWENLQKPERKDFIQGPGTFVNERGMRDISGNTIVHNWRESIAGPLFLTAIASFWNAVVYGGLTQMMSGPVKVNGVPYPSLSEAFSHHPFILIFILFPIVGAFLAYLALCSWLNKTTFHFDGITLSKTTAPLPVLNGSFKIARVSIEQVYVQKNVNKGSKGSTHISYRVIALRNDGPELEVHNAARSYQSARILEQWLESRLGIEDRIVPDEVA